MIKDTNGQKDEKASRIIEDYILCNLPDGVKYHGTSDAIKTPLVFVVFAYKQGARLRMYNGFFYLMKTKNNKVYCHNVVRAIRINLGILQEVEG